MSKNEGAITGDAMEMNCPHCQKPLNRLALLVHFGGPRTCPECKKSYIVKYDWTVMAMALVVGVLLTGVVIWVVAPPNGVKGFLGACVLGVSAMIASRPEIQN
jgi:hypothetical protein